MNSDIKDHFSKRFGRSLGSLFQTDVCDVISWENPEDREVVVITTVGMSRRVQFLPEGEGCPSTEPRTELMAYCCAGDETIFGELLSDLATYPFQNRTYLHWWHTLMIGRPIVPGSHLCGFLISMPPYADPNFSTFWVSEKRVDVLWIVPISASERELAITTSAQALERELEANEVDVTDLKRRPTVT